MIRLTLALAAASVVSSTVAARADSYLVFQDDRPGFQASLDVNALSTIVDSGGAFAPNPAAATNLASIVRSGTIGGQAYTWVGYDFNFSNSPTGLVTPGVVGGDNAGASPVDVEAPVAQGGATGLGTWGLDSGSGGTTTRNAFLVDFTSTPGGLGIGHFGLDLVDFEAASAFTRGTVRLYRGGALVFTHDFDWGAQDGNGQVHFLGVVSADGSRFDQAVFVVGDDSAGGGNSETWGADRVTFGQAVHNPEPSAVALFALGAVGLGFAVRRRRSARTAVTGDTGCARASASRTRSRSWDRRGCRT